MANFASINTEFSDFDPLGANFKVRFINPTRAIDITLTWSCVSLRTMAYQYTQGIDGGDQGGKALQAVFADVGNHPTLSAYMNVSLYIDAFAIEANEYGWSVIDGNGIGSNITINEVPEVVPVKDFQLTGYSLEAATVGAPCSFIKVNITEVDGVAPYTWINPANPSTTLSAEIARLAANQTIDVTLEDSDTDQATLNNVVIPRIFSAVEIDNISVVTNPSGIDATVTVFMLDIVTFPDMLYSLDGITYQASNVFSSVIDGSYTLYVQDGFGCIATTTFDVDTSTSVERANPYALVPLSNSIRLIPNAIFAVKNIHNTLYKDEVYLGENKPFYGQLYETGDGVVTTQFRSNYDGLSARLLDCSGQVVDTFAIEQKSENLGATDKRDATAFNLGDNQTGIYFTDGNIYDPISGDIIDTYALNGNLPEWGAVGNTIVISDGPLVGSYLIKQVKFDSTVQANILVIDFAWTPLQQSISLIVGCTYDRLPYEVYEFYWDLAAASAGRYQLEILMTDSLDEYPDLSYISDYVCVADNWIHSNLIIYSNSDYTALDYTTGYEGRVRLRSLDPYASLEPAGEQVKFDDSMNESKKLKDVSTMEGVMYIEGQPRYMVEKVRLILQHKSIEINNEKWTNIEGMETINFQKYSLKNINVRMQLQNYNPFANDNVLVDGTTGRIITKEGAILQ